MIAVAMRIAERRRAGVLWFAALIAWPALAPATSLSEAVQAALENDPSVAVIRAQYESDLQSGRIERAGLLPTLDLSAAGAYARSELEGAFGVTSLPSSVKIKDSYGEWNARAELRQPLLRTDWFDRLKRARAQDALAEIQLLDAQAEIVARASQTYLQVELAQDLLKQSEAEARAVRRSLEDMRRRFEVELVPGTDVKEAQARDDLAQARLIAARRDLRDALELFAEVTGMQVAGLPGVREDASLMMPEPVDAEAWVRIAAEKRPSLITARLQVEVARTEAASSRARGRPQIDAVASGGRNDSSDYVIGQVADDARIGLELRVPIYAGGSYRAQNQQADARVAMRQAELKRLQQETEREVRRLYRSIETGLQEVKAFRRSLDSAIAAEEATRNGFEAGTRTITDVLDAQSRVAQASRDWNTARYDWITDMLLLKRVAGTLSAPDFLAVDRLLEPQAVVTPSGSSPAS